MRLSKHAAQRMDVRLVGMPTIEAVVRHGNLERTVGSCLKYRLNDFVVIYDRENDTVVTVIQKGNTHRKTSAKQGQACLRQSRAKIIREGGRRKGGRPRS